MPGKCQVLILLDPSGPFVLPDTHFHLTSQRAQALHLPPNLQALPSQLPLLISPHNPRHLKQNPGLILPFLFPIYTAILADLLQSPGYKYHVNADSSPSLFLLRLCH